MALILVLRNTSALAPVSDYEYGVYINDRLIDQGNVKGHTREEGWPALVQKMLDQRVRHDNAQGNKRTTTK